MSQQHTPEPWYTDESCGYPCDIHDKLNGDLIVRAFGDQVNDVDGVANARRIVACVNACAGMQTESLESGDLIAAHRAVINAVTKQRDELLAALDEYINAADNIMSPKDDDDVSAMIRFGEADKTAREAIARAKGGA